MRISPLCRRQQAACFSWLPICCLVFDPMHSGAFISVCIIDVVGRDGVGTRSLGAIRLRWMAVFLLFFFFQDF